MDLVDFSRIWFNFRGFFVEIMEFPLFVGAWWGQKAKILKKYWFLKLFWKGQEGHGDARTANNSPGRGLFWLILG